MDDFELLLKDMSSQFCNEMKSCLQSVFEELSRSINQSQTISVNDVGIQCENNCSITDNCVSSNSAKTIEQKDDDVLIISDNDISDDDANKKKIDDDMYLEICEPSNVESSPNLHTDKPILNSFRSHLPELPKFETTNTSPYLPPLPVATDLSAKQDSCSVVLTWSIKNLRKCTAIGQYHIYAYNTNLYDDQTTTTVSQWSCVGTIEGIPPPIYATFSNFERGRRYFFALFASDIHNRNGPFSNIVNVDFE
ncbi:hypothetical protein GJ496_002440 [Pomphorhynchus laevis]|nr:hypothetical protein GJ496_002440 [Pomphorhynchus laevis]